MVKFNEVKFKTSLMKVSWNYVVLNRPSLKSSHSSCLLKERFACCGCMN